MRKLTLSILLALICALLSAIRPEAVSGTRDADVSKPAISQAVAFAVSSPIEAVFKPQKRWNYELRVSEHNIAARAYPVNTRHDIDAAIAKASDLPMPSPSVSFDGLSNYDNIEAYGAVIIPPDMIGDVGPHHYVQAVNALVLIFDKSGNPLTPPFRMSEVFGSLGTPCSNRNDGEAIVLYDQLADRWLLSQYCTMFPPFRQMVAISKTGDPRGAYFVYEFVMPNVRLNDVAKFGVWPDGYYMSTDEFVGSDFAGSGTFAFDRAKMLAGDPTASYVYFNRPSPTTAHLGNLLPADLDGLRPPPDGAPNTFVGYTATEYGDPQDAIRLFDFHADFAHPDRSTFTERPESPLPVASFDPTSPDGRTDITQPAPGERLDANSDRLNYRAGYRNFGKSESIVFNQTVRLSQVPYRAGVRLYELKRSDDRFSVAEQSTIGDTNSSRWIGTAAQDHEGDLAIGYNRVSDSEQPSILYTGRLAGDPTGSIRNEATLITGTGVQKAFGWRWGDYSAMSVDPADDCTFWFTGEYYTLASQNFSDFTWLTRIGAFKFPQCTPAPRAGISGTVTNAANGQPIEAARITASVYSRYSMADGRYGDMSVTPAVYTITASANGFRNQSFTITALDGQPVTQNFSLTPIPVVVTNGTAVSAESCMPNGAPDPGEAVTIGVSLRNTGAQNTEDLVVSLLPGGGVLDPGPTQDYGVMPAGGASLTRPFSFTVDPAIGCGGHITLTFHLQDGSEDLGSVTAEMQTGAPRIAFQQNFDRSHLAQLPIRWSRSATDRSKEWTVSLTRARSGTRSAFSPDPIQVGVNEMVTPIFAVMTPNAQLSFHNWYEFETTFLRNRLYDGSVLEIRIGDGEWQDILDAGGAFESGGYDGLIDACCQNPLSGRLGWSGRSGVNQTSEFITTKLDLPPAAAGNRVQLRWRVGTDVGGFREGQYIDDVLVTDGFTCGCK